MQLTNYSPLIYNGNGKLRNILDSVLVKTAIFSEAERYLCYDPYTGEAKFADLGSDKYDRSEAHNIYLDGWNRSKSGFMKGWTLKYDAMWQYINSPMSVTFPMSLMSYMTDQQGSDKYYYQGTTNQYKGDVQTVLANMMPQSNNHYWAAQSRTYQENAESRLALWFELSEESSYFHHRTSYVLSDGGTSASVA